MSQGSIGTSGILSLRISRRTDRQRAANREASHWRRRNRLRMLLTGELFVPVIAWLASCLPGITAVYGTLRGTLTRGDGTKLDLGVLGYHLVVTAGKNYLAACMDNTSEPEALKYHGYGTGATAAAASDTALQTELTTQYATDNIRPTGSQAHATNTYTTVATLSPDTGGTIAVTEWGLLSQAATGGGTLFDHQVFSAVSLIAGSDSLATTYILTFS